MLDFINKQEYFEWLDQKIANPKNITLKGIQDSWILSLLQRMENLKIAEIGGGSSRVLSSLAQKNECWNIDKMEGLGNGPTQIIEVPGTQLIRSYMGEFSSDIPSNYFDVVFSISVVEHVPRRKLGAFFLDCHRILKPGAIMLHAIDLYVFNELHKKVQIVDVYRQCIESHDFSWLLPPAIDGQATFRCSYASNSDSTMNAWNQSVPSLAPIRQISQSVSIKMFTFKNSDSNQAPTQGLTTLTKSAISEVSADSQNTDLKGNIPNLTHTTDSSTEPISVFDPIDNIAATEAQSSVSWLSDSIEISTYYRSWAAIIAILAISLNMTAFFLGQTYQQILSFSNVILILFLVAYMAFKVDYTLAKLERVEADHRKMIKTLRKRVKRLAMRQKKSNSQ